MNKYRFKYSGFTLIELIISIVILSIGAAAFLTLILNTTKNSVDPQVRVQANAIARAYLEEIMLSSFCDPDWDPDLDADGDPLTNPQNCSTDCGSSACAVCKTTGTGWTTETRSTYDDICDYTAISGVSATDRNGLALGTVGDYTITVTVNDGTAGNLNGLTGVGGQVVRVDVDVSHNSGVTTSLSSYKTNY